ncbi:hypothetical protein GF1_30720 [Desulfolithobacter dissulfuricans]|uniref:Uncharacterized protein n=1 Tax=Desulfolithobacter dissulfuricans TaxID=2795293 RepID=A0A915U3I6_9BACT|nr:hypothetical protein [Desulfolithobacter dissulfuricans]BCO10696.1 hypothetical protein GF1_30720 [Desulfolithobacter dissulfuricans]
MESLKVYILIANRTYNDGIRSGLGLAVENHYAYPVVMNGEFPTMSEYMSENIAWIYDMEGEVLTCGAPAPENLPEGVEFKEVSLEELGERMREADVIIPYGLPKQTNEPPPACAE